MAASIYATPPPDLSSEDTALSDVSNSSTLNTQRNGNSNSNSNNNNTSHNTNTNTTTNTTTSPTTSSTTHQYKQQQPQQQQHHTTQNSRDEATSTTTINKTTTTPPPSVTTTTAAISVPASPTTTATTMTAAKKQRKRSIAEALMLDGVGQDSGSNTNASNDANETEALLRAADVNADDDAAGIDSEANAAAMNAVAAAANAAMQLRLLEAINDAAKKRRKQHNPSRHEALNLSGSEAGVVAAEAAAMSEANEQQEKETNHELSNVVVDYEEKLSKMFLPKSIEQLKEQFEMLQQKQQQQQQQQQEEVEQDIENISQSNDIRQSKLVDDAEALLDATKNPYQTYCKQCGENFETEFKLSLHMLQEHPASANGGLGEGNGSAMDANMAHGADNVSPLDFLASVKVKLERGDSPTGCNENEAPLTSQLDMQQQQQQQQFQMQQHHQQQQQLQQQHGLQATDLLSNGKDHWLNALPPPGFPGFPPEAAAAAALSAGGYLPLLGVGVPGFPGVDGLNRPPLRIFNPEAYCELCNKEFCNKYFLKTHKANKHGIYDPAGDAGGNNNNSNSANNNNAASGINAMNQMFQLQMQQQQQQQQQQHQQQQQQQQLQLQLQQKNAAEQQKQQQQQLEAQQALPAQQQQQQLTPPAPPAVHCDICSKRFTNIFAMRRHRAKIHEQRRESPNGTTTTTTTTSAAAAAATPQVKSEQQQQQTSSNEPASNAFGSSTPTDGAKPFQMPEGFRQDFTLEQEEVSFTPQPRKLSPQMQQQAREANFAHDKLRRLGVVNPEAFCEICCKEYCNKYFLRTHKWKRHGIFVPPEDLKDEQLQLAQKMAWPFMNLPGMPLNLMLANEKAVAAQRMLAAAAAASVNVVPEQSAQDEHGQSPKRIKLEPTEQSEQQPMQQDEYMDASNAANAQAQSGSLPGTPEPQQKSQQAELLANLPPSPEAAMQNLQKLQSMLQQLNDLNGKRPVACHLCGRELEHQYALQAHIMTEHAGLTPGLDAGPLGTFQQQFYQQQQTLLQQQQQQQQQHLQKLSPTGGSPLTTVNELRCQQCERDFNTPQEFKQHIAEVHLLPSGGSPLREGFFTPERPINPNAAVGGLSGGASARPPYTITPTSSYCEICNKELCNKYFMKTHMQRMHGIEIENGAQIGGVVCNICNKELCSKYFLRVHKHNTHGIIEEGAPLPQPRGSSSNSQNGVKLEAQQAPPPVPQPPTSQQIMENELSRGPNMSPFGSATASSYLDTCPLCTRHFRSFKWLRSHLMNDHGAAGIDKLRELEQQYGGLSKSNSPTLKIPNGVSQSGSAPTSASALLNPANLAQALQNLNAQHLLEQKPPKHMLPGMFGTAVAEQALQSPRYKEYQCSLCNFTTPYYAFLFIHERSHAITDAAGLATDPQTLAAATSQVGANNQTAEALPLVQEKLKHETPEPTNLSTRTPTPTTSTPNKASPTPTTSPTLEDETTVPIPQRPASKHQSSLSPVIDSPTATYTTTSSLTTTGGNLPPSSSSPPTQPPATRVLSPTSTTTNGPQLRSAATSPIESLLQQRMLSEMAAKSGKPTSYALPKLDDTTSPDDQEEYQMQAFHIECVGEGGSVEDAACAERLMPAIIYLPVRKPIVGQAKLSFNLTPA